MYKRYTKVNAYKPPTVKLIRTVGYARVSSGKDAMLNSLSSQISYYSNLIQSNPEWAFSGIYADEAYTGTKDNRPEFQRLLADCRAGKIDQVLVKSISRFARNTVTLLETVRELKELGIDVFFERENLHTMSAEGELMITLIAAVAQEESRSVSENCKWRIRQDYATGKYKANMRVFGYRWSDGEYVIIPDEADIVRQIFDHYLSGMTIHEILRYLQEEQLPAPRKEKWTDFAVRYILRNERYIGDMILQKDFVTDHISKTRKKNKGELVSFYLKDTHDAIIDRDDFARVQIRIDKQAEKYAAKMPGVRAYPYSGRIVCGHCGKTYTRKVAHDIASWNCGTFVRKGKAFCHAKQIRETVLDEIVADALGLGCGKLTKEIFVTQIERIIVPTPNHLVIEFGDGRVIEQYWTDPTRSDSWDTAARAGASERMRARQK